MARTKIGDATEDLISDSGSVIWSLIKGEQLEYPITLEFISDSTIPGYIYEAVIVEALNTAGQIDKPKTIMPSGVKTTLTVRRPTVRGAWSSLTAYNYEDVVTHEGLAYKLLSGVSRTNSVTPDLDPFWTLTTLNKVYIQFPASLGSTWTLQPTVDTSVYGFFELQVTEPTNAIFTRSWKPVRGMVEIQFSPTDIVT